MSDFENLPQSPENAALPEKAPVPRTVLTDTMLIYLRETSPWLRFIGILGFIGCGFMLLGGIITAVLMFAVSGFADELDDVYMGVFGLVYAVLGAVNFFPARFIYSFGARIRNYQLSNSELELEQAFKNNKSFWKFIGIICIIYLAFIPLGIILVIVVAVNSAFM
ncbi:MAG: hypothetical protein LBG57_02850 [Treponema sp.]|nr:hypothetical protein [Treponema sp.]